MPPLFRRYGTRRHQLLNVPDHPRIVVAGFPIQIGKIRAAGARY
jgi:hypothetical protein